MIISALPRALNSFVGSESKEFAVKAERAKPISQSLPILLFGVVWTAFTGVFVFAFFGPLFSGEEVRFTTNGQPTVASVNNLEPLLFPAVFIGVFILIGLIMVAVGIYMMRKKGGYFVGTQTRLIHYRKGTIRSIDWEQFSGDIEVSGNDEKGNISLQMRSGKMVSRNKGSSKYVPNVVYMTRIPNPFEVERICRKRIKENDPTPAVT